MSKLSLYPYSFDMDTIIKHQKLLKKDLKLSGLGFFREHKKLVQEYGEKFQIQCTDDKEELFDNSDILLLGENNFGHVDTPYLETIRKANQLSKKVLLSYKTYKDLKINDANENIIVMDHEHRVKKDYDSDKMFQIQVPIISVMGMGENCDKFELQILLKEYFDKSEYKVEIFSSNSLGYLFGMNALPESLFSNEYSFREKIIAFNHYIYDFCNENTPDLIVIGFPGGILPIDDGKKNYFSEIPLVICNAVSVDLGLLNLYFPKEINERYLESVKLLCKKKFNLDIVSFGISNQMLYFNSKTEKYEVQHICNKSEKEDGLLDTYENHNIFNIRDHKKVDNILDSIVDMLETNIGFV